MRLEWRKLNWCVVENPVVKNILVDNEKRINNEINLLRGVILEFSYVYLARGT